MGLFNRGRKVQTDGDDPGPGMATHHGAPPSLYDQDEPGLDEPVDGYGVFGQSSESGDVRVVSDQEAVTKVLDAVFGPKPSAESVREFLSFLDRVDAELDGEPMDLRTAPGFITLDPLDDAENPLLSLLQMLVPGTDETPSDGDKRTSIKGINLRPMDFDVLAQYDVGDVAKADVMLTCANSTMPAEVRDAVRTILHWSADFAFDEAQSALGYA